MARQTQPLNDVKLCRKCGIELTEANWPEYHQKHPLYICQTCHNAGRRERYPAQRRVVQQAGNAVKLCRKCGVVLEAGKNCSAVRMDKADYICGKCSTKAARDAWIANEAKCCRMCGATLVDGENCSADSHTYECDDCRRALSREQRRKAKLEVMEKYGGVCACCNESRLEFLTIDHINGGGRHEFKQFGQGARFYRKLILGVKRDDLRVLCMNCNFAIGRYGYYPHQLERDKSPFS